MKPIVEELKNSNIDTFNEVFYSFSGKLYSFIYDKTKSEYFANEVTQITFIKLWNNREKLNCDIRLSTQIFQIAKTTLIDELRKEDRNKSKIENFVIKENLFLRAVDSGYEDLNRKEVQRTLNNAIQQLPPIRKRVFQLSREEQLSYKEISEELSISVKTVDKHIQLALRYIKPLMRMFMMMVLFAHI